jgi:hypothetical protein
LGWLCTSGRSPPPHDDDVAASAWPWPEQLESAPCARGIESDGRTSQYAASSENGGGAYNPVPAAAAAAAVGGGSTDGFCSGGEPMDPSCAPWLLASAPPAAPVGFSGTPFLL